MMRLKDLAASLPLLLCAALALAWSSPLELGPDVFEGQVVGTCSAGKNCTGNTWTSTGAVGTNNVGVSATSKAFSTGGICLPTSNGTTPAMLIWRTTTKMGVYGCSDVKCNACPTSFVQWDTAGGGQQWFGVATGSLPACVAGLAGTQQYDTTTKQMKFCNGTNWLAYSGTTLGTFQTVHARTPITGVIAEDSNMVGSVLAQQAGTNMKASCTWVAAGTGGSTGVTVQLYDQTAGSAVGSCNLTCTTGSLVGQSCSFSGTVTNGNRMGIRITSATDCAANPSDVECAITWY